MKDANNIWLLVGRETDGNNTKNYILMDYNGCTQFIQKRSIIKFCREHEVVNVQLSGNSITGKGIAITALPRYVKQQGFGLQQVGGMSQNEVIQLAQPLINQYIQKKDAAQQRKEANSPDAQKAKQNEYVVNKLIIIEDIIITALAMKDITNELASNEHITRYLKQIDIDNADGDSLTSLVTRNGVTGLVNGLVDRLDRLNSRITKYSLDKSLRIKISELKSKCNDIRDLHNKTKQIIRDNREQDKKQISLLKEQSTELYDIPVVDDISSDMIAVDFSDDVPILEDVGTDAIEVEQCDFSEIASIEDIFKREEPSKEDKELEKKIKHLCDVYSRAVTTIGNIIHNPNRIAEVAHAFDMEYPGVHKKLTDEKINTSFETEEELISAISEHYDYITHEDNRSSLWRGLMDNHLGKAGQEVYKIIFSRDSDIDDVNFNRHQELFDYYMQTLIDKIVTKLNEDKLQCIEKSKQKFTKMSPAKREKMLEDVFGDSWYRAGNSLEEYGSSGWGGWTANDERNKAKRDTLVQYAGLSDEEFVEKITKEKEEKLLWKCRAILPELYAVDLANGLTANSIINQHEIVLSTAVSKIISTTRTIGLERDAFSKLKNHPEDRSILLTEALRCFNKYDGKYNNEAFGVGIFELDDLVLKYRNYNMNYCIELLSNVQIFIDNINTSMIELKHGWLAKLRKEYYNDSELLLAKVYYIASLCKFKDLYDKADELDKLLDHTVFEVGETMKH